MTDTLNLKQDLFCREYLVDLNATKAAIRAGYSQKTAKQIGQRLLKTTKVNNTIQELQLDKIERLNLSTDEIIINLKSIVERCMQAEPILDKDGRPTGLYRFNAAGAIRALELLGRHIGMFSDKLNVEHKGDVAIKVNIVRFGEIDIIPVNKN